MYDVVAHGISEVLGISGRDSRREIGEGIEGKTRAYVAIKVRVSIERVILTADLEIVSTASE